MTFFVLYSVIGLGAAYCFARYNRKSFNDTPGDKAFFGFFTFISAITWPLSLLLVLFWGFGSILQKVFHK